MIPKPSMFAGVGFTPSKASCEDGYATSVFLQQLYNHCSVRTPPIDQSKHVIISIEDEYGDLDMGQIGKAYSSSHIGDMLVSDFEDYAKRYKAAETEKLKLQVQIDGLLHVLDHMSRRYLRFGGSQRDKAYLKMSFYGRRKRNKAVAMKSDRVKDGSIVKQKVKEARAWWRIEVDGKMIGYRHMPYEVTGIKAKAKSREGNVKYERELLKMAMTDVTEVSLVHALRLKLVSLTKSFD